jgi:CHAT domain-containing protein
MRFEGLPASAREAGEVAGIWKETAVDVEQAQVFVGRAANESTFKQLGPGSRVLHLATHGFFLGDSCASGLDGTRAVGGLTTGSKPEQPAGTRENPLLLSGLALAGANRRIAARPDEEDGILTAEEVASLNLEGVEWAVLSACDTGLGELKAGEGVFGLRRAFQVAGVRTVIMSLWSVEDRAARQWMLALYRGRLEKKLDTADAVREAGLTVLRDRRAKGLTTHPFYWAGFVAAGDWR